MQTNSRHLGPQAVTLNTESPNLFPAGRCAGTASVKLFNKGHSVGSKIITYQPKSSEVTTGIVQILLHQLGVLCDLLLVRRELPSVDDVDALLSGVFQDDDVSDAIPAVSFEKFLESYRFLRDTGLARPLS